MTVEPRTEAGKRLLAFLRSRTTYGNYRNTAEPEEIANIEAEARAAALREVADALRFVAEYIAPDGSYCWCHDAPHPDNDPHHPYCIRATAILTEATGASE